MASMSEESPPLGAAASWATGAPAAAPNESTRNEEGLKQLRRKIAEPAIFRGGETESVREWCDSMRNFLHVYLGNSEVGRLPFVFGRTGGIARQWISNAMARAKLEQDREVEWKELEVDFILAMEGPHHLAKLWAELKALRLGAGKCKELTDFNLEWDKLRTRIQDATRDFGGDAMWGMIYADCIRASNQKLYDRTVMLGGIPESLDEWRAKLSMAVATQAAVPSTAGLTSGRAENNRFTPWRNGARETSGVSIRVNNVEETGAPGQEDDAGDQEGAAGVNAVQANKGRRGQPAGRRDQLLDHDMRQKLYDARRCFRCYEKGHQGKDCRNPTATAPPTAEQLKA